MTPAFKVALGSLLLGSVVFAYLGPPPRHSVDLRLRAGLLALGMAGYVVAAISLASGSVLVGALATVASGELVCAAGWLSRGQSPPADDDDDGGGGGGGRDPKPPPVDWDAFEHAFRRHARERDRQPA
jgi:hypothetical protein